MKITQELWAKMCDYANLCKDQGIPLGRHTAKDALKIPESVARGLVFMYKNKHLLSGEPEELILNDSEKKLPRILIFDIETAPGTAHVWGTNKQYVDANAIIERSFMLGWTGKWLFDSIVHSDFVTSEEALARDDSRVTKSIWTMLDQADIVVAHKGDTFDIPWVNTLFLMHGFPPPSPYQSIDTLTTLTKQRQFKFMSNKLDYVNRMLGLRRKLSMTWQDWMDCKDGKEEALRKMEDYGRYDSAILEETYLLLRPWIKSHPNVGLYVDTDKEACAHCGCTDLQWGGSYVTPMNRYSTARCPNCGAMVRSRHSELTKEDKDRLTRSLAR